MVVRTGGAGNDTLNGTSGSDTLSGRGGNDSLFGLAGDDALFGEAGDDRLEGGDGIDEMVGGSGVDTLNGNAGDDTLYGATDPGISDFARDVVFGGDGDDILNGGDPSGDRLGGGDDNDFISVNNDQAFGDAGDDVFQLRFTEGALSGGTGADLFDIFTEEGNVQRTTIDAFSTSDTIEWRYRTDSGAVLGGPTLFDRLDTNNTGVLTASDSFTTGADGVRTGVSQAGDILRIFVGEDSIDFAGNTALLAADWA